MRRVRLALLLLFLGLIFSEILARVWYATHPAPAYRDYLLRPAPAYKTAPYWSTDFASALSIAPLGCDYESPILYRSTYFNVDGKCRRRVVGQIIDPQRTVWLFGNSTLYNGEIPDEYTIPSQLQALLKDWRVISVTSNGAALLTQWYMIEQEPIQSGDIVITYDGVSDAGNAYFDIRDDSRGFAELLCKEVADAILSTRPLCAWQPNYMRSVSHDEITPYAKRMEARYKETIFDIREYVKEKGAIYLNVIQPHLWSRTLTEAEYELEIIQGGYPRFGEVIRVLYPYLAAYADLDLTHILDNVRNKSVVFFDGWHGNHTANKIIARVIADAIR